MVFKVKKFSYFVFSGRNCSVLVKTNYCPNYHDYFQYRMNELTMISNEYFILNWMISFDAHRRRKATARNRGGTGTGTSNGPWDCTGGLLGSCAWIWVRSFRTRSDRSLWIWTHAEPCSYLRNTWNSQLYRTNVIVHVPMILTSPETTNRLITHYDLLLTTNLFFFLTSSKSFHRFNQNWTLDYD